MYTSEYQCTPFTRVKKVGTARQIFGTVPRLPVPRLTPGGSLGTSKFLSTGATLHLGPIRLHVEIGSACLKIVSTVPKILRAVPIVLARVNGVFIHRYVPAPKVRVFEPFSSENFAHY